MTLQQLLGFISVARTKNISLSAKELYITQPTLSNQIKALEKELGYKLFIRSKNGIELTEAGHIFLTEAKYIIGHYEKAKMKLHFMDKHENEILRIGYFANHELKSVLPFLTKLKEKHKNFQIELKTDVRSSLLNALKDNELDFVITYYIKEDKNPEFDFKSLYSTKNEASLMLVVPEGHPLSKKKSCSFHDLDRSDTLWLDLGLDIDAFEYQDITKLTENIPMLRECHSVEDALALCEAGFGVTMIPDCAVPENSPLCFIPIHQSFNAEIGIYYNPKPEGLLKEFISLF